MRFLPLWMQVVVNDLGDALVPAVIAPDYLAVETFDLRAGGGGFCAKSLFLQKLLP